jgi:heat shock protein HslJ
MKRLMVLPLLLVALSGCIFSREASTDLPGTSWSLVDLDGAAPVADAVPTMEFGEDGTVSGNASCNQYNAEVTIDGSDLSFGPVAMTRMMCPDPAAAEQETAFTIALEGVSSYTIDSDGRLVLEGDTPLTFEVAPEGG